MLLRTMLLVTLLLVGGCAPVITDRQWSRMDDSDVIRVVAVISSAPYVEYRARADSVALAVSEYLRTERGFEVRDTEWTRAYCDSVSAAVFGVGSDTDTTRRVKKRCSDADRVLVPVCYCRPHMDALRTAGVDLILTAGVTNRRARTSVKGHRTTDGACVMYANTSEWGNMTRRAETGRWVHRSVPFGEHVDRLVSLTAEILEHPGRRYELDEEQPWTEPARLLLEE